MCCRYTTSLRNPTCRSARARRSDWDRWDLGDGLLREPPNRPPPGAGRRALTSRGSESSGSSGSSVSSALRWGDADWDVQLAARRTRRHARATTDQARWRTHVQPWLAHHESKESKESRSWGTTEKRLALAQKVRQKEEQVSRKDLLREAAAVKARVKDVRFLLDRQLRAATKQQTEETQHTIRLFSEMVEGAASDSGAAGIGLTFSKTGAAAIRTVHRNVVKQFFVEMDDDKSGLLDESEVRELALALGTKLKDADVAAAMAEMDEDGSGEVDFAEFYAWWVGDKPKSVLSVPTVSNQFFCVRPFE